MNYPKAIEYLSGFSKGGKPVSDLSRFSELMRVLGDPQKELNIIHVAGTNGKGSVCEYISSALSLAGCRTGKFTSPYITVIEERIQINNKPISREDFALYVGMAAEGAEKTGCPHYSQFELLNAAAFLCYKDKGCDYVVLEAGIGGLLDSTNIVTPKISVITTVDLDHCAILGNTPAEIARNKAGIIKPCRPIVSAPFQYDEVAEVLKSKAEKENAPFIMPRREEIRLISSDLSGNAFEYKGKSFKTRMCGKHQTVNAAAAIEALRLLSVPEKCVEQGIFCAQVPARTEKLGGWLIDGAHNPSGARAAYELLKDVKGKKLLLTGMLESKDWQGSLKLLIPIFDYVIAVDFFAPSAVKKEKLGELVKALGKEFYAADNLSDAMHIAENKNADLNTVCGSLYLCGAVRRKLMGIDGT